MKFKNKNIYTDKHRNKISVRKVLEEIVTGSLASAIEPILFHYIETIKGKIKYYVGRKKGYWK